MGNFTNVDAPNVSDSTAGDGGGQPPRKQRRCSGLDRVAASTSHHADGGESPRDQPHHRAELPVVEEPAAEFEDLPDEVVIRILSYLKVEEILEITQHVCRRWRQLSHDPEVWRNKTYYIDSSCSDDEAVIKLQQMKQLRSLEVDEDVGLSVIDAVCENCKQLTSLALGYCHRIDRRMLEKLVNQCPNIKVLEISAGLLNHANKAKFVAKLQRLESLVIMFDLKRNKRIYLRPLTKGCPKLNSLEVCNRVNVPWHEIQHFMYAKGEALCTIALPWAMESSNGMRCIVPLLHVCTTLSHLELYNCKVIGDEAREAFTALGQLPNLRMLVIEGLMGCPAGEAARPFVSGMLTHLQVLQILNSSIQDDAVLAACQHCPQLEELQLIDCPRITDKALGNLHHLRELEMLDLSGCRGLRGEMLGYVAQVAGLKTLNLESLNMRHLEPGLGRILDLTSLEELSLNYSLHLSIFPFGRLGDKLLHLRKLNLILCRADENVLKTLQEQLPNLKVNFARSEVDNS